MRQRTARRTREVQRVIALIRKNLLYGRWGALAAVVPALLASVLIPHHIWEEFGALWDLAVIFVISLGVMLGINSFGADSKDEAIRFLDYLPLRRLEIWLANYLPGLLILGLVVLAFAWRAPFLTSVADPIERYGPFWLSGPGWPFVLAGGSVGLLGLGLGAFSGALFLRENPAAALVLGLISLHVALVALVMYLDLTPKLDQMAPLAALSGGLFAAASLVIFILAPAHLGGRRRFLLAGASMTGILSVVVLIGYTACQGWAELVPGERLSLNPLALVHEPHGYLLVEASSGQSAEHMLAIDVENEQATELGRGLELLDQKSTRGFVRRACFYSKLSEGGLWPGPRRLILSNPASGAREALGGAASDLFIKEKPYFEAIGWAADPERLLVSSIGPDGDRLFTKVFDRQGVLRVDIPLPEAPSEDSVFVSAAGQVLGRVATEIETGGSEFIILDLTSGLVERFQLPGRLLSFSPDLSQAVCALGRVTDGICRQSVVVVDLASKEQRILLSEDQVPAVFLSEEQLEQQSWRFWSGKLVDAFSHKPKQRMEPELSFDSTFSKALWNSRKVRGELYEHRLVLVDLASGRQKPLMGPERLPRSRVAASLAGLDAPVVYGFLPDASSAVVEVRGVISILDATSGELVPIVDRSKIADSYDDRWFKRGRFSPDRRRLLVARDARQGSGSDIDVYAKGQVVTVLHTGRWARDWLWFDDDRILVIEASRVHLVAADGSQTRILLDAWPGPDRRASPR